MVARELQKYLKSDCEILNYRPGLIISIALPAICADYPARLYLFPKKMKKTHPDK